MTVTAMRQKESRENHSTDAVEHALSILEAAGNAEVVASAARIVRSRPIATIQKMTLRIGEYVVISLAQLLQPLFMR
jgi:hypothetical protein